MLECTSCGAVAFSLQDGFYFCDECGTQSQEVREQVAEAPQEYALRVAQGTKVIKQKKEKEEGKDKGKDLGKPWTTMEGYQCLLKAMVNALISMGVDEALRDVVWEIWKRYLKKSNVAFNKKSTEGDLPWSLNAVLSIRDRKPGTAENPLPTPRKQANKSRRRKKINDDDLTVVENEEFYEDDDPVLGELNDELDDLEEMREERKYASKTEKKDKEKIPTDATPECCSSIDSILFPSKISTLRQDLTIVVIYIALRFINEPITANDLVRWIREGHLPYHKASEVLPMHMKFSGSDAINLCSVSEVRPIKITYSALQISCFVGLIKFPKPDLDVLKARIIIDLDLSEPFHDLVASLMKFGEFQPRFSRARSKALHRNCFYIDEMIMAYIIITMKLVYFLDDKNERIGRLRKEMTNIVGYIEPFNSWANRIFLEKKRRLKDGIPRKESDLQYINNCKNYSWYCATNVFGSWQSRRTTLRPTTGTSTHARACGIERSTQTHKIFAELVPDLEQMMSKSTNPALPLTSFPLNCYLCTNTRGLTASGTEAPAHHAHSTCKETSQDRISGTSTDDTYLRYLQTSRQRAFGESYQFLLGICAERIELRESELQYFVDVTEMYLFTESKKVY